MPSRHRHHHTDSDMADNPEDLKYTREHEWVRLKEPEVGQDGGEGIVGITAFAAESLGDVVLVDLPKVGDAIRSSEKMGEIESVKAVSDLYSPVTGSVIATNEEVAEHPEWVNEEPYGRGWLLRVRLDSPTELDRLLSVSDYEAFLASQP